MPNENRASSAATSVDAPDVPSSRWARLRQDQILAWLVQCVGARTDSDPIRDWAIKLFMQEIGPASAPSATAPAATRPEAADEYRFTSAVWLSRQDPEQHESLWLALTLLNARFAQFRGLLTPSTSWLLEHIQDGVFGPNLQAVFRLEDGGDRPFERLCEAAARQQLSMAHAAGELAAIRDALGSFAGGVASRSTRYWILIVGECIERLLAAGRRDPGRDEIYLLKTLLVRSAPMLVVVAEPHLLEALVAVAHLLATFVLVRLIHPRVLPASPQEAHAFAILHRIWLAVDPSLPEHRPLSAVVGALNRLLSRIANDVVEPGPAGRFHDPPSAAPAPSGPISPQSTSSDQARAEMHEHLQSAMAPRREPDTQTPRALASERHQDIDCLSPPARRNPPAPAQATNDWTGMLNPYFA